MDMIAETSDEAPTSSARAAMAPRQSSSGVASTWIRQSSGMIQFGFPGQAKNGTGGGDPARMRCAVPLSIAMAGSIG